MSFLKKQKTMRFLRKKYNQMKKWSDYNPSNYLHFTLIMKAELAHLKNVFRKAFTFYDSAIKHARANGFIRYEALANELSAKFLLGFGQEKTAAFYMKEALSCYSRWGAVEKIRHLNEKYHTLLSNGHETDKFSEQPDNETNILQSTAKIKSETLDLDTIIKTSQSISGEINLEKLLGSLIKYVLENSGAEKAFLILENEGKFTIEAEGNIEKEEIKVLESIPLPLGNIKEIDQFNGLNKQIEKNYILPFSILQYTIRTKNHLVLQDAYNENLYKNDPYIIANRTKSVICAPIMNKGKFIGLLYLENNLTASAFTDKRLKMLNILASQAAISIENAHLYQTAQNEITERKQTESALRESEKRFRNSVLNAPYPIMIHAEGDVIELSNIWTKMTGYNRDDIPSIERWIELAYRKYAVTIKELINKLYDLKEFQYDGEWEIIIKDGSTRIWDFSTSPIGRLSDGRRAVISMAVDITERKRAKEELQQSEAKFRDLVESSSDWIWEVNAEGVFMYAKPAG